jgi:esterase/lipase
VNWKKVAGKALKVGLKMSPIGPLVPMAAETEA